MRTSIAIGLAMLLSACGGSSVNDAQTLNAARAAHKEILPRQVRTEDPVPLPPKGVLNIVHFPTQIGDMVAYLTPAPAIDGKHPAIIWISGGNLAIGDFWSHAPRENDQSARAFREAGVVQMYPSQRGGNGNPGAHEGFYGEVDDIRAAADWLAKQPWVDSQRIYLGGHSTGATLALLVAESDSRFRATFAFGPISSAADYGGSLLPFSVIDPTEIRLRAPAAWLNSIKTPVFVFEGDHNANTGELKRLQAANNNPLVNFFVVPRADHFSTLAPLTEIIAKKIIADSNQNAKISFSQKEINQLIP